MREFQVHVEKNKNFIIDNENLGRDNSVMDIDNIINNILDGINIRIQSSYSGESFSYGFYEIDFKGVKFDDKDIDYLMQITQRHSILNLFLNETICCDESKVSFSHGAKPVILSKRLIKNDSSSNDVFVLIENALREEYPNGCVLILKDDIENHKNYSIFNTFIYKII